MRRLAIFHGWPVLFVAVAAMVGTLPGRTQGLGLAVGPLLLAWCVEWTGSYSRMFTLLAVVLGGTALAALILAMPDAPGEPVGAPSHAQ
ncbi:MAG: hypothetical protein ACRD1U_00710 [Vicinamibacterales bacterium]